MLLVYSPCLAISKDVIGASQISPFGPGMLVMGLFLPGARGFTVGVD